MPLEVSLPEYGPVAEISAELLCTCKKQRTLSQTRKQSVCGCHCQQQINGNSLSQALLVVHCNSECTLQCGQLKSCQHIHVHVHSCVRLIRTNQLPYFQKVASLIKGLLVDMLQAEHFLQKERKSPSGRTMKMVLHLRLRAFVFRFLCTLHAAPHFWVCSAQSTFPGVAQGTCFKAQEAQLFRHMLMTPRARGAR